MRNKKSPNSSTKIKRNKKSPSSSTHTHTHTKKKSPSSLPQNQVVIHSK